MPSHSWVPTGWVPTVMPSLSLVSREMNALLLLSVYPLIPRHLKGWMPPPPTPQHPKGWLPCQSLAHKQWIPRGQCRGQGLGQLEQTFSEPKYWQEGHILKHSQCQMSGPLSGPPLGEGDFGYLYTFVSFFMLFYVFQFFLQNLNDFYDFSCFCYDFDQKNEKKTTLNIS